ncbi:cyclic nucleotide-binding domain-containing protein [Desulfobacca acetoxidans]|uniref:Putative transcriptional regulator, Crp/Fnr family n=1 Tax=Desulfobacca acetoxidans (strain ATCC 700848 / DSM 11109 / ASRB2) TaxID=880072 RepID=F2NGH4_DESAR|nr:cyclic nucleotide-binding domain-containing protein [Desulfobacca acetoxidans]AEB08587.1 putative transcriptional regulator, Crp/Fnr family [Desulfobacca acetoxidans DSM 11109]
MISTPAEGYLTYIRKNHLLQELTDEELQQILRAAVMRNFGENEVIMQEGDSGDAMYIMCEGIVQITKRLVLELDEETPRDKVIIRFRAEEGVILGEMALIESDVRSATVTALTPCQMLELHKDAFYRLLEQFPEMGVKILLRLTKNLSHRLRKSSDEVVKLTTALAIALES